MIAKIEGLARAWCHCWMSYAQLDARAIAAMPTGPCSAEPPGGFTGTAPAAPPPAAGTFVAAQSTPQP